MSVQFEIHDVYTDTESNRFVLLTTFPDCIRCGKTHEKLYWHELRMPGETHNCWAMCPLTMEPLLAYIEFQEEEKKDE